MEPLISVILPVYNIKDFLPKCLDSVFHQTYSKLEIILIDDGSTDGSSELCDFYKKEDNRVVVYHKENGGLSDARNYGIKHSNGEYITCIDPDDFVDLDYISYLYALICKYQTKMSICQHRVLFPNGKIEEHGRDGEELLDTKTCLEKMMYHDGIDTSAWAKLYQRNLFDKVQYPVGRNFEDIGTTYLLMMECEKIAIGNASKYNYIVRKNSIVNSAFNLKKLDLLTMTDKMANDVKKRYPDLAEAVLRRQVYARFSTLNQMLDVQDYDKERNDIISYIKNNKSQVLANPKIPKRDKFAYFCLNFGFGFYKFIIKRYFRIKKGI